MMAEPDEDAAVDLAPLEAAVQRDPEDPDARRRLAAGYFRAKRMAECVEQFERVARLQPGVRSHMDLGNAYMFTSRLDDAIAMYEKVLAAEPGNPTALYNMGNVAAKQADHARAIRLYQQALLGRSDYLLAQFQLAQSLQLQGNDREAYEAYAKVLDMEPTNAEELKQYDNALYSMAQLDMAHGAQERAAQLLSTLIEANPEHPNAHYLLGQILLQMGRTDEAQRHFEAHMQIREKIKPTSPVATGQ